MNLLHVPLKIIQQAQLTDTASHNQLTVDVKEWEATCVEDSPDKVKAMYAKMHKTPLTRVLMPFAYILLFKWFKDIMTGASDDDDGEF